MTCTCRGNHNRSQTGRFSVSLYVEGASRQHWHGNAVGTPGIFSPGNYALKAGEKTTLYNPFHSFPRSMEIASLRYMFTWINKDTRQQYYYGNIVITPESYHQTVRLEMPVNGTQHSIKQFSVDERGHVERHFLVVLGNNEEISGIAREIQQGSYRRSSQTRK